jgi:hypothetical protein
MRPGAGAKPQPGPPRQYINNSNLKLFKTIHISRHMVWRVGNANFAKVVLMGGGHGFEPGGLQ